MNTRTSKRMGSKEYFGIALMVIAALVLFSLQYYAHSTTYATVDVVQATGVITDAQRDTVDFANKLKPISFFVSAAIFTVGLVTLMRARGNTSRL